MTVPLTVFVAVSTMETVDPPLLATYRSPSAADTPNGLDPTEMVWVTETAAAGQAAAKRNNVASATARRIASVNGEVGPWLRRLELDERRDLVALEPVTTVQGFELDEERERHDLALQ